LGSAVNSDLLETLSRCGVRESELSELGDETFEFCPGGCTQVVV
jgi:hypothetical protein